MAWTEEHLRDSVAWFNPWPIKYGTPVEKWLPLYEPNEYWEVIGERGTWPTPPEGVMVRWWKQPKDTRPYKTPFEPKVFGAWPASQVTMAEDLAPSIWPGRANVPPWGFIKLVMPGTPDISGDQNPKNHHIHMTGWKIHMRYLSMTQQKVMTVVTPFGPRYFLQSKDWEQHQNKEQAQLLRSEWVKRRTEKQLAERAAEINAMLTKLAKENQRPKTPNGHPDLFA